MAWSSRSAATVMGCCGVNPARRSTYHTVDGATVLWKIRPIRVRTRDSVHRWSSIHPAAAGPCCNVATSLCTWASDSTRAGPEGPLDAKACSPPAAQARRHVYADLVDTSNRAATTRGWTPSANIAAACRRTCSRRARACGPTPPPSLYRMPNEDMRCECLGITQTGDVDTRGTSIMRGR